MLLCIFGLTIEHNITKLVNERKKETIKVVVNWVDWRRAVITVFGKPGVILGGIGDFLFCAVKREGTIMRWQVWQE